jgi:allantoinase
MVDLVIKNASIVSEYGVFQGAIAIKDGKIAALGRDDSMPPATETIDAKGHYLLPGGVDPHVHIRYPGGAHRENFTTGTWAAAAGGATTIIEHPISSPPQYSTDILLNRVNAVKEQAIVDVAFLGAAGGEKLDHIRPIAESGIVGYKTFLHAAPEGREKEFIGLTMKDNYELFKGFQEAAKTGLPIAAHAEDNDVVSGLIAEFRAEGKTTPIYHARSRPAVAEVLAVERLLRMARETDAALYLVHISVPEAVRLAAEARRKGQRVFIETCPHYLLLTEAELEKHGPYAKCNPPLRTSEEIEAMWECVAEGLIDTIGSDHGPFTIEEKEKGYPDIFAAPAGFPGLEVRLPLMLTAVKENKLSIQRAVELLSTNPSKIFGLYPRKGALRVGSDADIVLVDMETPFTVDQNMMLGKSKGIAKVYEGWELYGRVVKTIVRGKTVYCDGRIMADPGYGEWLRLGQ